MKRYQKGASLFLTLIVLIAMLFAVTALMRSVSVANMVAGNLAFRDAAMHAADAGFRQAMLAISACGNNTDTPATPCGRVNDPNFVSMTQLSASAFMSSSIWENAHAVNTEEHYQVKYIIDRLSTRLTNTQDSIDVKKNSLGIIASDPTPSAKYFEGGRANNLLSIPAVFYRITVRVEGPNRTVFMAHTTATVATNS